MRAERGALLGLLALALAGCDDGAGPTPGPSTFDVYVYVEVDDSTGMGALDEPVSATVSVASHSDEDGARIDSTGADGHVRFEDIAGGGYTVAHVATSVPAGAELTGSAAQSVFAPSAGDTVDTRFVYRFVP